MSGGMKCQNCGKGIMYGHNVSHSKRRTRRIFKPNLHTVRIKTSGVYKRMKLCAKCTRKLKSSSSAKASADKQKTKVKSESKKLESEEVKQFSTAAI